MSYQASVPERALIPTHKVLCESTDPSCSSSDLTTTRSSTPSTYSTYRRTVGHRIEDVSLKSKTASHTNYPMVFELLKSQCTRERIDTEDVADWLGEMRLSPGEDRKQKVVQILKYFDGIIEPVVQNAIKQCPSDQRPNTTEPTKRVRPMPVLQTPTTHRRKRTKRSKASQSSRHESERSHNSSNILLDATTSPAVFLACPFPKHDRARYFQVGNGCTRPCGFKKLGRLIEHVKRVHSLRVPCCMICKKRFNRKTLAQSEHARNLHVSMGMCQLKELSISDSEWMTEEQDARFSALNIQGSYSSAEEKWRCLYRHIFDVQDDRDIPDPYYEHIAPGQGVTVASNEHIQSRTIVTPIEHEHQNQPNRLLAPFPYTSGTATMGPEITEDLPSIPHGDGANHSTILSPYFETSTLTPSVFHREHTSYSPTRAFTAMDMPTFTSTLTETLLDLNHRSQPGPCFSYDIYQGHDSGYQSLEQPLDPNTAELAEFSEFIALPSEGNEPAWQARDELELSVMPGVPDADIELTGLQIELSQFPENSTKDGRHRRDFGSEI